MRLGARLFVGAEVLSLVLALGGFDDCASDPIVFPDGGGGTGGVIACGDTTCVPDKCYSAYECQDGNYCHPTAKDPSFQQAGDACHNVECDPEVGWSLVPVPVDDGNPCTEDSCNPVSGDVNHFPIEGCTP